HRPQRPSHLPNCSFLPQATATPQIYALSLHDALPILNNIHFPLGFNNKFPVSSIACLISPIPAVTAFILLNLYFVVLLITLASEDRKSTRLNSSHVSISYAVFCLNK